MELEFLKCVEYQALRPELNAAQIQEICTLALEEDLAGVLVNGAFVELAAEILTDAPTRLIAAINYPLGTAETDCKRFETEAAVDLGAAEIEVVFNLGLLRSDGAERLHRELRDIVEAAEIAPVRVVLETALLDGDEIEEACRIAAGAGAHCVKAGTGFYGDATVADVETIASALHSRGAVAAGGGFRELHQVEALVTAGAQRVTTPFVGDLLAEL